MNKNTYIDCDDFERAVCERMGISPEHFRDYHLVVGGDYKDLWHVIIALENGQLFNGQLVNVSEWLYDWEGSEENLVATYGEDRWWLPFLEAVDALHEESDVDLMVHFYW